MRPERPRLTVQTWVRSHQGMITARDANRLEIPGDTIQAMVESEFLERTGRGIYRSRAWPERDRQRAIGLCLAHPGLMLSHTSAGQEWQMRRMADRRLHVLCRHASSPMISGVVVHRCRSIDPVDIVEFDDGVLMTSPPRTVFDSSSIIGLDATISVIEQLIDEFCTFDTLEDTVRRLYHPRRPGSQVMRAALASRPPWRAAMQSGAEERVLAAMSAAGLPTPVTQCPITLRSGHTIRVDFGWPEWQVAVEVDDPFWHDFLEARRRDKRRDLQSAAVGWVTARVPTTDRGEELTARLDDLRALLEVRGWRPLAA